MATTYNLMYRVKGSNSLWTLGASGLLKQGDNSITGLVTGLTNGTTYEFRFRRVIDGVLTDKWSSTVDATPQGVTPVGDSVSTAGTFSATLAGNSTVLTRTASQLQLNLTANWEYVQITGVSPAVGGKTNFFVRKSGNQPLAGSTADTSVIAKVSTKVVAVYLDRTHSYTVLVVFNGGSSGTVAISSY